MLYPRTMREDFDKRQEEFREAFKYILHRMEAVMTTRGQVRDVGSPIYVRRSPGENLGIAKGKLMRIESLLTQLEENKPAVTLLEHIREECIDAQNYLAFIAALCEIMVHEEIEVNDVRS